MKKSRKLKLIKKWRFFRDSAMRSNSEEYVKSTIMKMIDVRELSVEHGWTCWVSIQAEEKRYTAEAVFLLSAYQQIVQSIYKDWLKNFK